MIASTKEEDHFKNILAMSPVLTSLYLTLKKEVTGREVTLQEAGDGSRPDTTMDEGCIKYLHVLHGCRQIEGEEIDCKDKATEQKQSKTSEVG